MKRARQRRVFEMTCGASARVGRDLGRRLRSGADQDPALHAFVSSRNQRAGGSVVLIVLVTMMFATMAMALFIEKAGTDLLVDVRAASASRLRLEATSALETTLGVLEDFRDVLGGLHSPEEGWSQPLEFAGYTPSEGREVHITFEDESGKISLPTSDQTTLVNVFKAWSLTPSDAERAADAILGWMKADYTPSSASAPQAQDYETGELPFTPPHRSLRTFSELASINAVREIFFTKDGKPNEYWDRFVANFSLFSFRSSNVNAAAPDLLAAAGSLDPVEQQRLGEYLQGAGAYQGQGARYFKDAKEVGAVLGKQSVATQMGTEIRALRIHVLVTEGTQNYRLSVVVAVGSGGAKVATASKPEAQTAVGEAETKSLGESTASTTSGAPTTATASSAVEKLNYPFTVLEMIENTASTDAPQTDTKETAL